MSENSSSTTITNNLSDTNWRPKLLIGGALFGALIGLLTAYLMARNSEDSHGGPPELSVSEMVGASVAVLGVVRTIAALGD